MKRGVVLVAILSLLALSATGISWGDIRDPYTYTVESTNPTRTVIVGVTMGNDWTGFQHLLPMTYNPQYKLDVELPLYVIWIVDWNHTGGTPPDPQPVNPPQPLSSYSWFAGHHDEFWVKQIAQLLDDTSGYKTCPEGVGLEAPQACGNPPCEGGPFPLTADGKLRVTDTHGGIGDITRIHLVKETCCVGGVDESYNIVFQWDRPGIWYDWQLGTYINFAPGMTRNDVIDVVRGGSPVQCWMPTRIVQWVSPDLGVPGSGGPSPRTVDASDLAYWTSFCEPKLGQYPRWGFPTETPPGSPTYQCDVVPDGGVTPINASDLARFYGALGHESCQLSKAGDPNEFAAMLDWFGVAPTGEMAPVPNEGLLPVYAVVDWEKNRRAIADPYGYLRNLNSTPAKEAPWGLVKQLYR